MEKLIDIISEFNFKGIFFKKRIIKSGHINDTYILEFTDPANEIKRYILQKINTEVFKNPDALMKNIDKTSKCLQMKLKGKERTLSIIRTKSNELFLQLNSHECWRAYDYIENTNCYQRVTSADQMHKAGKAIANFHLLLADFKVDGLHMTIKEFHNTALIYDQFVMDLQKDTTSKVSEISEECLFFEERKGYYGIYQSLKEKGELPLRVCHNDTKFNNILFDKDTDDPVAIIDLDTVMPGFILNDFGDAVRTGANMALEDEADLEKVHFNVSFFESFTKGYLEIARVFITQKEAEWLAVSPYIITLEQGIRFLHDHIKGDIYFKTSRKDHNLDRARNQIKLAKQMELRLDNMKDIVNNLIKSNSTS